MVGELNGALMIQRARAGSECAMGEVRSMFRQSMERVDRVFTVVRTGA